MTSKNKIEPDYELLVNTLNAKELRALVKAHLEKGISKYKTKQDLINGFYNILTDDQKLEAYKNHLPKKVRELFLKALQIILQWKNAKFDLNEKENEYSLRVDFGSYDVLCTITIEKKTKSIDHDCSCNISEAGGICMHQIALFGILYVKDIIEITQFPVSVEKSWLKPLLDKKAKIIEKSFLDTSDPDSADIEFDEYFIFIQGNNIILKWEGDYAGSKTVDVTQEKENTVEKWLVKKIVDMQLKSLAKYGRTRELISDKFGVIEKILKDTKQFPRLQKAFERAETKHKTTVPKTKEEIEKELRMGLIE